ncbi:MAG: F0F1 ATP synthase subunit A [Bacteroidales bacterium]|jgi:F-type H+-transporting ATPase subunit a|nr:F0F1 ATP synthase subunit A [Bacteroidales bacterium]
MIIRPVRYFLVVILLLFNSLSFAQHTVENNDSHSANEDEIEQEEIFNAGDMILEHIVDSYEWHILSYGDFHLSFPLPVIVYHDGSLITFLSSAFHHGHSPALFDANNNIINSDDITHNQSIVFGLAVMHDGAHKGKLAYINTDEYLKHHQIVENTEAGMPYDFSITKNVLALWLSLIFILWVFISVAKSYKSRKGLAPKGIQSMLEPFIIFIRDDIAKASIGERKYEKYLPYLLTIFFFIFFNNLIGLIPFFPGGANLTGNIAVTMVLALFTFVITNVSGNKNYWVHLVNTPGVPWWLKFPVPLMPIVEFVGLLTKPFVLMVRLFANITAGHIIVLGFISLIFIFGNMNPAVGYGVSVVSIAFAIFLTFLEFLVALIQAYVFTLLSALYFGAATEEHH